MPVSDSDNSRRAADARDYDKVTQASMNGIYVKAQELDRGHNEQAAPSMRPAGCALGGPDAVTGASDATTHATEGAGGSADARSHASSAAPENADAQTCASHVVRDDADAQTHASDAGAGGPVSSADIQTHASDGA